MSGRRASRQKFDGLRRIEQRAIIHPLSTPKKLPDFDIHASAFTNSMRMLSGFISNNMLAMLYEAHVRLKVHPRDCLPIPIVTGNNFLFLLFTVFAYR